MRLQRSAPSVAPQGGRGDIGQGEYNVYGLKRTPDALIWTVNGKEPFRYQRTDAHPLQWPFTTPFYLLLDKSRTIALKPAEMRIMRVARG